jgi:hypothetical protein
MLYVWGNRTSGVTFCMDVERIGFAQQQNEKIGQINLYQCN